MKKKLLMLFVVLSSLFVASCTPKDPIDNPGGNNENNNQEEQNDNIPQSWKDLFTFDNVTIMLKNNLTKKQGDEYKCINGNWYLKAQGEDTYVNHDGKYIFDIYYESYSKFSYDSENTSYKATDITLDESGYLRDITITVNDGKITNIYDLATLNSSSILSILHFYDYGVTTLEEKQEEKIIEKILLSTDTAGIYATSITLGSAISDKGEIVIMYTGEKGSPQENKIIVTIRLDYEKDTNGKYKYTTTYNDEVYQNKSNLDKVKFDLVFDNTTRASRIVVTYAPIDGSTITVYDYIFIVQGVTP